MLVLSIMKLECFQRTNVKNAAELLSCLHSFSLMLFFLDFLGGQIIIQFY